MDDLSWLLIVWVRLGEREIQCSVPGVDGTATVGAHPHMMAV